MASWSSAHIEANGIRLHYTRTGGSGPPLVLAHGFSDDGLCWTAVAEALAPEYDAIMIDARCHGGSEAPEKAFSVMDQVDDLAGAITGLGLEEPLILGHSMGAMTALALAGAYPDLPRAILLEDPPARWMRDGSSAASDAEWRERTRARLTDLKRKSREELIASQRAATPGWSDAELGPWADAKLRLHLNVLNRDPASSEIDWPGLAGRIACPALLITGDPERGAIVKEEEAAALQSLVPQLRVAHIRGAGHSIRRDQFAPYLRAVRAFLADLA
jgi:N-formylmaleamate deformylase